MTPLERAEKVRELLIARLGPNQDDPLLYVVPTGSLILTPDEATMIRYGVGACGHGETGVFNRTRALALLAGKGQT